MHPIIFLPYLICILIAISAFSQSKGSAVVIENPNGTGFTMDFKKWSSTNEYELSLNKDDELLIETVHENGEIALAISGKNGSEPYEGKNLKTGMFTVTVSETDVYVIQITGNNATGKVAVKNQKD